MASVDPRPGGISDDVFSMKVKIRGFGHQVDLHGELDLVVSRVVEARLVGLVGPRIDVDLSTLVFLDAQGLASLVRARRRIREAGRNLRLVGATGIVRRVFEVTALEAELDD
jgi:anti-anti-sigma factor